MMHVSAPTLVGSFACRIKPINSRCIKAVNRTRCFILIYYVFKKLHYWKLNCALYFSFPIFTLPHMNKVNRNFYN